MSLFDKLRRKATDAVEEHGHQIEQGLDKAADFADDKTGGKYSDKIDSGVEKAKQGLDKLDGRTDGDIGAPPPPAAPPPTPPPA